jgi:hypothetical protein
MNWAALEEQRRLGPATVKNWTRQLWREALRSSEGLCGRPMAVWVWQAGITADKGNFPPSYSVAVLPPYSC